MVRSSVSEAGCVNSYEGFAKSSAFVSFFFSAANKPRVTDNKMANVSTKRFCIDMIVIASPERKAQSTRMRPQEERRGLSPRIGRCFLSRDPVVVSRGILPASLLLSDAHIDLKWDFHEVGNSIVMLVDRAAFNYLANGQAPADARRHAYRPSPAAA